MRIAILGAGAWGTALAVTLGAHHEIRLWVRRPELAVQLHDTRFHPELLQDIRLPDSVTVLPLLSAAVDDADIAIVAVSVLGAPEVLKELAWQSFDKPVILACKGFHPDTGHLPHALAHLLLKADTPVYALSGPSFAREVAQGKPTALVLAGPRPKTLQKLTEAIHHPRFRLYSHTDVIGVEVAGALKNVIAIAAGLCDTMGLGHNARAALITRGLAEIKRLGTAMGAHPPTFQGLAGMGDLVLTCTSALSRNYRVGVELARKTPLEDILSNLGEVAEGVNTAKALPKLWAQYGLEMPISGAVHAILFENMPPEHALQKLLERDPRAEV